LHKRTSLNEFPDTNLNILATAEKGHRLNRYFISALEARWRSWIETELTTALQPAQDIDEFTQQDVRILLAGFADSSRRLQRLALSHGSVWIKRYGTERSSVWRSVQTVFAAVIPFTFLRPSPKLNHRDMISREVRRMETFREKGFLTPSIIYRSPTAIILSDAGETVAARLAELAATDPLAHDALLINCAGELGRLHAAGLCHRRPHPRDFVLNGEEMLYLDFEEEPEAVMPLAVAQARDIWLLLFQIASTANSRVKSMNDAYGAWVAKAPSEAAEELRKLIRFLRLLLPIARIVNRVRAGQDITRFVVAMTCLMMQPSIMDVLNM